MSYLSTVLIKRYNYSYYERERELNIYWNNIWKYVNFVGQCEAMVLWSYNDDTSVF
jgi:hypothetical protein